MCLGEPSEGSSIVGSFLTNHRRALATVLWLCALITFPFWNHVDPAGWDIGIYHNAIVSLQSGHDPYLDAITRQNAFHRTLAQHPNAYPPFSYVYSPVTLPLLRLIGYVPSAFACFAYWLILAASILTVLWVTGRAGHRAETTFLILFAPLAIFSPGLLANDTILSGNIAFIIYGFVLLTSYYGWTRGVWHWCYLAILVASCFKPPLLTLLAIPVFSARRQTLPAAATATLGLGIFAAQSHFIPTLFLHFMQAVQLQFTYNHDFGSSPAGVFSDLLAHRGAPYSHASLFLYALYATSILIVLFTLSRQYLEGNLTLRQWMPVLLTGTILLNPRIMEYDAAPLAIPMGLLAWRFFTRNGINARAILTYLGVYVTTNIIAVAIPGAWKPVECLLLTTVFSTSAWSLLQSSQAALPSSATEDPNDEDLVAA